MSKKIFIFIAALCWVAAVFAAPRESVRIGVLAKRGPERCLEKWSATTDYLCEQLPEYTCELVPLDFNEIFEAAADESVDFLLANSALYVELAVRFGATRIATLNNLGQQGTPHAVFGGVVFFRKDQNLAPTWDDLRKAKVAAVDRASFGGWLAALREMKDRGLDTDRISQQADFLGTHDAVVYAVRDGWADAGVVRSDTLERMASEGKIDLTLFSIIPCDGTCEGHDPFTRLHSTRLYPEWAMAKAAHTSDELAQHVAIHLMSMPPDSAAAQASRSHGWLTPLDYHSVEKCLQELRARPFEDYGKVTLGEALKQHKLVVFLSIILAGILIVLAALINHGRQLRESETKYRAFFENSTDAMLIIEEGEFVDCNDTAAAMLGYDRKKEVIHTHPSELSAEFQPDGRASVEKAEEMIRLAQERGSHRFEWEHLRKDGTSIPVEVSLTSIPGDGGTLLHTVWRDMTARKQAEKAFLENERKFRALVESSSDWIWEVDVAGIYTYASPQVEAILGYKPEEVIGQVSFTFMLPEDAARTEAAFREAIGMRTPITALENVNLHKDGRHVTLETSGVPIVDEAGMVVGYRGVDRDITERKKGEAALLASMQKLALHVQQTPLGVVGWDLDFKVTEWNLAAERIFGYTQEEALGKPAAFIIPESARAHTDVVLEQLLKKGGGTRSDNENITKDGRVIICEWYNTPLINAEDEVVSVASLVMDVTERKEAEEAREELEVQLRQAQKMEAVGQMAGGIAHDFNNLLQIIGGYAELSQADTDPKSSIGTSLKQIDKAAQRGKSIVRQLLAFSRRQVIDPIDLDLNKVCGPLLNMIQGLIGEHIKLEIIPETPLGTVHVDRGLMEQVLVNLCVNARDAMPEGGTLTIETKNILIDSEFAQAHSWAAEGPWVLWSVSDTGCGIEKQTLERIFEPFFTTKEVGKGTGLGLSMVYGIIEQHNGHISAYSEVDQGSHFKIYLPVVGRQAGEAAKGIPGPVFGGTETLLVAEDDAAVLELAELALRAAGYTVLTAKNGEEAIQIFEEHAEEIDMLIFDVVMPRMGGKEAMEHILKAHPDMPHLFASGYSENAVHTNFIQNRGLHLLSKPYQTSALLRKIREVLDGK